MSLSRAELEAMDRDELIDKVRAHERRLNELSTLVGETLIPRLDGLEDTNDDLQARVAELEGQVTPDPAAKPYQELSRDEKVYKVRVAIARDATSDGRSKMNYEQVRSIFNNHPSVGHAYTLMKLAGNADGFEYQERSDKENRLVVKLEAVNDERVVHAVNNADESGGS